MNKILLITVVLISTMVSAQDKEIYRIAFENKNHFDYLNFYDDTTLDRMDRFKVYKITNITPPSMFKYNRDTYYTKELADSLLIYSNKHNKTNTVNYINKISELLTFEEQDYLYNAVANFSKNDIESIPVGHVSIVDTVDTVGFMFYATNIVYTRNNKYAFLRIGVEAKDAHFLGISTFIFEKENKNWKIIYINKFLAL